MGWGSYWVIGLLGDGEIGMGMGDGERGTRSAECGSMRGRGGVGARVVEFFGGGEGDADVGPNGGYAVALRQGERRRRRGSMLWRNMESGFATRCVGRVGGAGCSKDVGVGLRGWVSGLQTRSPYWGGAGCSKDVGVGLRGWVSGLQTRSPYWGGAGCSKDVGVGLRGGLRGWVSGLQTRSPYSGRRASMVLRTMGSVGWRRARWWRRVWATWS